jgi:hypothetical protein
MRELLANIEPFSMNAASLNDNENHQIFLDKHLNDNDMINTQVVDDFKTNETNNNILKVEDSLTKSFKHKEHSIFKSMSLTSANNTILHPNASTHNNNFFYTNHNQFNNSQMSPHPGAISLYNKNNLYRPYLKNTNLNFNLTRPNINNRYNNINSNFHFFVNNTNPNNNNKRQGKIPNNNNYTSIPNYISQEIESNTNKSKYYTNKSSTNISSTSSLSSSSASSLKSASNQHLQQLSKSSNSPIRRINSFHNNNRNFSISPIQQQEKQTLLPHQYTAKDFNLKQEQFDLIKSYFDNLQQYSYLKIKLVKQHMLESIINNPNRREAIGSQVNEEDVNRTLNLIDYDKDGLFNFENFCDYLNLFLANKANLKEKLTTLIRAKRLFFTSQHQNQKNLANEALSMEETKQIEDFLHLFYKIDPILNDKDSNQINLFSIDGQTEKNVTIDLD